MKKLILTIFITLFLIYCVLFPKEMAATTASGLALWYKNVVPTLLPFSILSYIIIHSNLYHALFSKIQKILPENQSGQVELLYPMFLGFLFGFPIGAKLLSDLYETGHITGHNLTRYTAVCNQFGPAFVINYIGTLQLNSQIPIIYLLISIYMPPLAMLVIFTVVDRMTVCSQDLNNKKPASQSYFNFKIIDTGIINGFETMLRIAGYIVLFSILSGAINHLPGQHASFSPLVTGLLEVTTGVHALVSSSISLEVSFCFICGIVAFGGFCGLFQTKAIMKNCPFRITSYIILKLLCAAASTVTAFLLIPL